MKFIDIRAVRKDRRSKKWHIEYADGGSPSCIDTPISTNNKAISKECVVDINKTLHERKLVLIDSLGEIYDPVNICERCKNTLVSRIIRNRNK